MQSSNLRSDVHPEVFASSILETAHKRQAQIKLAGSIFAVPSTHEGMGTMRPLTPKRVMATLRAAALGSVRHCGDFTLRMGAYPISITDIVVTLFNGVMGRRDQIPSGSACRIFGLRLPRIALGIVVGAALSTAGAGFSGAATVILSLTHMCSGFLSGSVGASERFLSLIVAPHVPGRFNCRHSREQPGRSAPSIFLGVGEATRQRNTRSSRES